MSKATTRDASVRHFRESKLAELRRRHRLEEVVAPARMNSIARSCSWIGPPTVQTVRRPSTGARGALDVLSAIDEVTFLLRAVCRILVSAAASLGWIDRPRPPPTPGGPGSAARPASVTEIWSTTSEVVMLDPTSNLHLEKDGVPLNAYEIRQEWFHRAGTNLVFVVGKDRTRYRKADLPIVLGHFPAFGELAIHPDELDKYGFIGFIPNTDLMDAGYDYGRMFIVQDALCAGISWHTRTIPQNPAVDPYFPLGQSAVDLQADRGSVRVTLRTLTPNFERFEIRIDGELGSTGSHLHWPVHLM
jgi:hypothetical protein